MRVSFHLNKDQFTSSLFCDENGVLKNSFHIIQAFYFDVIEQETRT